MEPKHHLFEEEHHRPNLHCWVQNVNFQRCTVFPFWAKVLYIQRPYHTLPYILKRCVFGKAQTCVKSPWVMGFGAEFGWANWMNGMLNPDTETA